VLDAGVSFGRGAASGYGLGLAAADMRPYAPQGLPPAPAPMQAVAPSAAAAAGSLGAGMHAASMPSMRSVSSVSLAQGVGAAAAGADGGPRVDGKEFFRKARERLRYDQFNDFLANIKKLNNREQTRYGFLVDDLFVFELTQHQRGHVACGPIDLWL
jgi:hypothetical protein